MADKLDLILEKIETLAQGQAELHREVAGLKEGQAELHREVAGLKEGQTELRREVAGLQKQVNEMGREMGHMQAALFELLDGQKELIEKQHAILVQVDIINGLYGKHEVSIRHIKEFIGLKI
ncbi:MAG: hypothetical protein K6U74_13910 [Firmicutes bacterium]|nr:hypothetical protein [Bacillota bacterium]